MKQAVIIPTLNPTMALVTLVEGLVASGAEYIVVVNDGSAPAHRHIFDKLSVFEQVTVLTHPVNRGKGAALKTAFAYCIKNHSGLDGVVTADDDGQHAVTDILHMAEALSHNPGKLIMGIRDFKKSDTPARSYLGNHTVNRVISALYGLRLTDSQTGLRGIPQTALPWMACLRGEHYEYEINMLIQAARKSINIVEVPIQLIYFNNNSASHYKTIRDTLRIVRLLFVNLFNRRTSQGWLFRFTCYVLRFYIRKLSATPKTYPAATPSVYVAHHRNLKGVLDVIVWYGKPFRCWVLEVFCDRKRCYHHYAHFTLTARFGWPRVVAYPVAFIFSLYVSALMRSMRAIPVYRSSLRDMKKTLDLSIEALVNNEDLLIIPDVDYASDSTGMGEMYSGFVNLDKPYRARTGRSIDFIPLRVNETARTIETGAPSQIQEGEAFAPGKKRVLTELQTYLNL